MLSIAAFHSSVFDDTSPLALINASFVLGTSAMEFVERFQRMCDVKFCNGEFLHTHVGEPQCEAVL